ncbi:hypothetical protein ACHAPU_004799 [Fusarium lateritium]
MGIYLPRSVDASAAVTHHNLDMVTKLYQNLTALMVEVAKSLGNLNKKYNKQGADGDTVRQS